MSIQMSPNRIMWLGSSGGYIKFISSTNVDFIMLMSVLGRSGSNYRLSIRYTPLILPKIM